MKKALVHIAWLAASTTGLTAQGQTWVVDDGGGAGVDFTEIQAAVDAAGEGDTIVVEEGTYLSFAIEQKSLVVTAARDAFVRIAHPVLSPIGSIPQGSPSTIAVRSLSAAQRVYLRGIVLDPPIAQLDLKGRPGLELQDNAGAVWVEECTLLGNSDMFVVTFFPGDPPISQLVGEGTYAALVENCAGVVFAGCDVAGGIVDAPEFDVTSPFKVNDLHGLLVRNSNVAAYDCRFVGGDGMPGADCGPAGGPGSPWTCCWDSWQGGDGVHVESGSFHAAGCEIQGGKSIEEPFTWDPRTPGQPGDGLEVVAPTATVRLLDCMLSEGTPGDSIKCESSAPAFDLVAPPGTVEVLDGRSFQLRVDSPLEVGQTGTLAFGGDPGDLLFLAISGGSVQIPVPSYLGVLHVALPGLSVFAGVAPAGSTLDLPLTLGPLDPTVDATVFLLQSVALTTGGAIVLGAPSALVGVD